MILKVGLTGGIGSGKTTIARVFEILGIPVFYADKEARELINNDLGLMAKIIQVFGTEAYHENRYNVQYISKIVFNDRSMLEKLNNITHPHIFDAFSRWAGIQKNTPYLIMEAAILFESGFSEIFDYTITVNSPKEIRILRITKRDNTDTDKIMAIINNQLTDSERSMKADFAIINDNSRLIIPQVLELHEKFVSLQKK